MNYEKAVNMFKYDSATGHLLWNCRRPGVRVGMKAGFMLNGTKYVTIDWKREQVKNIVWLLNTGSWPGRRLHHRNGNRADTRFENLAFNKPSQHSKAPGLIQIQKNESGRHVVSYGGAKVAEGDPDKVLEVVRALLVY